MKWIATVTLLFALTGAVAAAGPDEDFLAIYNQVLQADKLQEGKQLPAAAALYLQARDALQHFHADHPSYRTDLIQYRLDFLADKLKELASYLPSTNVVALAVVLTPQQQITMLQETLAAMTNANAQLENGQK